MKFIINSGELREPIIIQRYKGMDKDDDGVPCEKWDSIINPKAKIVNIKFEEQLIAQGQGLEEIKIFYIRYPKGIQLTRKDRILYKNTYFNIIGLDDIENKGMYLAIKGEFIE